MRSFTCVTVVIAAVMLAGAVCQAAAPAKAEPPGACALLMPADLAKVVEGPATKPHSTEWPYTKGTMHDHNGVERTCVFSVGPQQVRVTYTTHEVTEEGKAVRESQLAQQEQTLRASGARVEDAKSGNTQCQLIAVDKGGKMGSRQQTQCTTTKGEWVVTVAVATQGEQPGLPVSVVKSLLDKASSRLP